MNPRHKLVFEQIPKSNEVICGKCGHRAPAHMMRISGDSLTSTKKPVIQTYCVMCERENKMSPEELEEQDALRLARM